MEIGILDEEEYQRIKQSMNKKNDYFSYFEICEIFKDYC